MKYEHHIADRIPVCVEERIRERELLRGKYDIVTFIDYTVKSMAIRLESYMLAEWRDTVSIHEAWPTNWWQAFRQRWFPAWWLRRWPVQMKRIDVEQRIYGPVCPHLHVVEKKAHLEWMVEHRRRP